MLVLLDQQQRFIISRDGVALLQNADSVSVQIESLASARLTRQKLGCDFANTLGYPGIPTFDELVTFMPSEHQSLLRALVDQINFVIFLCQQRLLQNKLLLGPPSSDEPQTPKHSSLVLFGLN